MKTLKKASVWLLAVLLVLTWLPAGAAAEQTGSISCGYVLPGAAFRLYLVGRAEDDGFVLTGDFADYSVDLADENAAMTLAIYAFRDGLPSTAEGVTDENGSVSFTGLSEGIYLLVGQKAVTEEYTYIPQPVLIQLPGLEDGTAVWDRQVTVKYTQEENGQRQSVSVLKLWEGDANTTARPESIEVQLLKDGEVYDTVTLSRDNNWSHTWDDLDGGCHWTVAEKQIPEDYRLTITGDGTGFVLTNIYTGPEGPGESELPQTGQLWWPVVVMAVAGLVLLIFGMLRRKGAGDYEQ